MRPLICLLAGVTVRSLLISLMLTSCALGPPLEERRGQFVRSVPVCSTDWECKLKWSATRQWIANAGMKLQHITPDFMMTYNPPRESSALAVRVVKEAAANGGYRINVQTWCNNILGCVPNSWDAAQDFNNYVNSMPTPMASSQ